MRVTSFIKAYSPRCLGVRNAQLLGSLLQSSCEYLHRNILFPNDTYLATNNMECYKNNM
jgi:hypothetical protein